MAIWVLFITIMNLGFLVGIWMLWHRLSRSPKDDPRLSRGLQILGNKIAILEDLCDRTDKQVHQLTDLLDQRSRSLQTKMFEAEKLMREIEQSMHKSREVAEIFQDRIPHEEILERQNLIKYVKAAQMAHQGQSIDEIASKVDLPREQLDFIAKVNRQQLMFDVNQLPEWAKPHLRAEITTNSLASLDFQEATADSVAQSEPDLSQVAAEALSQQMKAVQEAAHTIQKFEFRRI